LKLNFFLFEKYFGKYSEKNFENIPTKSFFFMSLEERILCELKRHTKGCTAKFLGQQLHEPKTAINKSLYNVLSKQKRATLLSGSVPPTWVWSPQADKCKQVCERLPTNDYKDHKEGKEVIDVKVITVILIDLGNVHDVLQHIENYADTFLIYAFADYTFSGYGVRPRPRANIHVFQSTVRNKNSADIQLVWEVAKLLFTHPKQQYRFFVVTKDNGFLSLEENVRQHGHSLSFVKNWKELASHLRIQQEKP
jgi:hypothetical protein